MQFMSLTQTQHNYCFTKFTIFLPEYHDNDDVINARVYYGVPFVSKLTQLHGLLNKVWFNKINNALF